MSAVPGRDLLPFDHSPSSHYVQLGGERIVCPLYHVPCPPVGPASRKVGCSSRSIYLSHS